jgi:general secretion pathway protein G
MRNVNRGFTLVEILIVVVILGILAVVVIPQFVGASESANASSLSQNLQLIRGQLELYQAQHNGIYPDLVTNGWDQLKESTDSSGNTTGNSFGPYLRNEPRNSFTNSSIVIAAGPGAITDGWIYDMATGSITAVGFNEDTTTFTPPGS